MAAGGQPATLTRKARNSATADRGVPQHQEHRRESRPDAVPAVESQSRTYLAGLTMVPTHNTAVKQLCKWLPQSAEMQAAVAGRCGPY